jgi:hypothetical protein
MKKSKVELFEVGKYYKRSDGAFFHILTKANTTQWAECLIVESTLDEWGLIPLSPKPVTDDWEEVPQEEWEKNFK